MIFYNNFTQIIDYAAVYNIRKLNDNIQGVPKKL